jgi:hypothetical protein
MGLVLTYLGEVMVLGWSLPTTGQVRVLNLVLTPLGQWDWSLIIQDRCWSWTGPHQHRKGARFWNLVLTHLGHWDWSLLIQDRCWSW